MRYDRNRLSGILPKAPGKATGGGYLQPEGDGPAAFLRLPQGQGSCGADPLPRGILPEKDASPAPWPERGRAGLRWDPEKVVPVPGASSAHVPAPVGDRAADQRGVQPQGGCLLHTGTGRMDPGLPGKAEDIQADPDPWSGLPAHAGVSEKAWHWGRQLCIPK